MELFLNGFQQLLILTVLLVLFALAFFGTVTAEWEIFSRRKKVVRIVSLVLSVFALATFFYFFTPTL